jgi:hypothetical protein
VFTRLSAAAAAGLLGTSLLASPVVFPSSSIAPAAQSDLDAFMERVLARRDENWKKLQQYILDETERIEVRGPGNIPVWGDKRDYSWFIREGYFIRSPLKANGVEVSDSERRKAEDDYLKRTKAREQRGRGRGGDGNTGDAAVLDQATGDKPPSMEALLAQTRQPEFIRSAYFLRFKFEQGKYALVGKEKYGDRDVLRIEYYPARLFSHEQEQQKRRQAEKKTDKGEDFEAAMERMMNKVSLVTIWVEPSSHQIVKYTFDNINFDFLPGAWLLRVDDLKASMTMSEPFKEIWLPRDIEFYFSVMLAAGSFNVRYHADYHDYREATATGRIKGRGGQQ